MNIQEYDLMNCIMEQEYVNQRILSEITGYSLGKVNSSLKKLTELGFGGLPVCMAKTQYSLSDDQNKLGRPTGFTINVRDVYVSAGAGFVVVLTGAIMTMPGLPKKPAADGIDVNEDGKITGLF